jgi:hypothetical protein
MKKIVLLMLVAYSNLASAQNNENNCCQITAGNSNKVWIGANNVINVALKGINFNDISIKTEPNMAVKKGKKEGQFVISVTNVGVGSKLKVNAVKNNNNEVIATSEFTVNRIPEPRAVISDTDNLNITPSEFKSNKSISIILRGLDKEVVEEGCEIVSFKYHYIKNMEVKSGNNYGPEFNEKLKDLINSCNSGDKFLFEIIKGKCYGDQASRRLNNISINIK